VGASGTDRTPISAVAGVILEFFGSIPILGTTLASRIRS
jgi:hypothetical protein